MLFVHTSLDLLCSSCIIFACYIVLVEGDVLGRLASRPHYCDTLTLLDNSVDRDVVIVHTQVPAICKQQWR